MANLRSHYFTDKGPTVGINSVCGDGFAFIPGTVKTISHKYIDTYINTFRNTYIDAYRNTYINMYKNA